MTMAETASNDSGARQVELPQVLRPERILCGIQLNSKKQLLQALAQLLSVDQADLDPNSVLNCLLERERVSNTGLGNGVALPHGRLAYLDQPLAAFIRMSRGIDYGASDGKPVDLLFAMVVPEHTQSHHLECLSRVGELLRDVKFSARLRNLVRPERIYTVLTEAERASAEA